MRVGLDTNVIIGATADHFSAQTKLIEAVIAGELTALATPAVLREYHRITGQLLTTPAQREQFEQLVAALENVSPGSVEVQIDDEEDRQIIAAALGGGATHLVTRDNQLLDIGEIDDLDMVTPQECWNSWLAARGESTEWQTWLNDLGIGS